MAPCLYVEKIEQQWHQWQQWQQSMNHQKPAAKKNTGKRDNGKRDTGKRDNGKRDTEKREVEIVDIDGIPYYVDATHNVYQHETILCVNPAIIGRWEWLEGSDVKRRFIKT